MFANLRTLTVLSVIIGATHKGESCFLWEQIQKSKGSEYDQEISQSHSVDQPKAPRGRATEHNSHKTPEYKHSQVTSSLYPIKLFIYLSF